MKPGAALRGVLYNDANRTPVAGMCVTAFMNDIAGYGVITDTNGNWTLAGLPIGRFGVSVYAPVNGTCSAQGTRYPFINLVGPTYGMKQQSPTGTGDIAGPGLIAGYELYVTLT